MSSPFFDYWGEVRRFRKTTSESEAELLIETGDWKLLAIGIKREPQDRGAFEDEFIYLLGATTESEEN